MPIHSRRCGVFTRQALGTVKVKVEGPTTLHDQITVVLEDVGMDLETSAVNAYSSVEALDSENVATFRAVPYGCYAAHVYPTGNGPWGLWPDDVVVSLMTVQARIVLPLRNTTPK
jgi:hypothetical protein